MRLYEGVPLTFTWVASVKSEAVPYSSTQLVAEPFSVQLSDATVASPSVNVASRSVGTGQETSVWKIVEAKVLSSLSGKRAFTWKVYSVSEVRPVRATEVAVVLSSAVHSPSPALYWYW